MPRRLIYDDDDDDNDDNDSAVGAGNRNDKEHNGYHSENDNEMDANVPPYWYHYFPGERYDLDENDDKELNGFNRNNFIIAMMNHFSSNRGTIYNLKQVGRDFVLHINLRDVEKNYPKIHIQLEKSPKLTISCLGVAAHRVFFGETAASPINVRLFNFYEPTQIKHLKASSIGRFVQIKGTVIRVSNIKPVVTQMKFTCAKCKAKQHIFLNDGKFVTPTKCLNLLCKSKIFLPDRSSAITVDWQKIRIQEIIENDYSQHEAGRIPRTVEIELTKDMVETCVPGDQVTVSGIVKVISTDQHAERYANSRSAKALYFLYIDGNSLSNNKEIQKGHMDLTQFSLKDLKFIQDISQENDLFHLIVNSLCPAIFGHEIVKAGLCLGLFGGVQKYTNEKEKLTIRGDPHILVVGDPGLGKSQLLTAVSHVAPRGVYVCGNTTSTSGLTVTVVRDASTGDYSLEAGALVLADQGTCCIDEFDKMKHEHEALLEAMEQQSISIAKAGIVCNLPARCSVIAAANPAGGHYNRAKTVSENLKISPALLSRFDLIFILLDRSDTSRDELLSEHVMKLHSGRNDASIAAEKLLENQMYTQYNKAKMDALMRRQTGQSATQLDGGLLSRSLAKYLRPNDRFVPMPPRLLRKYIAYARKYVHPKLTVEAKSVLREYYLKLRQQYHTSDSTPITTRQLESLIRLAQARARIELRDRVSRQDAEDVIDIMKESLYDVFMDEAGNVDLSRSTGYSKVKGLKAFISKLQQVSSINGKEIFTLDELRTYADTVGLSDKYEVIDKANHHGYLLKQPNGNYRFTSTN
jgi:DNA helicase MCM8